MAGVASDWLEVELEVVAESLNTESARFLEKIWADRNKSPIQTRPKVSAVSCTIRKGTKA